MKILKNPSPLVPRPLTSAARPHGRRGFSLVEMIAVVAIIGIIVAIGSTEITKAWRRQKLQSASGDIKVLFQRAYSEVQRRGIPVFVQVGPLVTSGAAKYMPIYLIGDVTQDEILDPFSKTPVANEDLLIAEYDIGVKGLSGTFGITDVDQEFCLSDTSTSEVVSTLWSNNAVSWAARRVIMCDLRGRAMLVGPKPVAPKLNFPYSTGVQIGQPATLLLTHVEVVNGHFPPPTRFILNINPVWSVRAVKQIKDGTGVWVNQNG